MKLANLSATLKGKSITTLEENCSDSQVVPGQAMHIGELLDRFTRGQRLNVHQFPVNAWSESNPDETFDDVPPVCDDIVDIDNFAASHVAHKADFKQRIEERRAKKDEGAAHDEQ